MNKYQDALNEICSQCKHSPKCRMFKTKYDDYENLQELIEEYFKLKESTKNLIQGGNISAEEAQRKCWEERI